MRKIYLFYLKTLALSDLNESDLLRGQSAALSSWGCMQVQSRVMATVESHCGEYMNPVRFSMIDGKNRPLLWMQMYGCKLSWALLRRIIRGVSNNRATE